MKLTKEMGKALVELPTLVGSPDVTGSAIKKELEIMPFNDEMSTIQNIDENHFLGRFKAIRLHINKAAGNPTQGPIFDLIKLLDQKISILQPRVNKKNKASESMAKKQSARDLQTSLTSYFSPIKTSMGAAYTYTGKALTADEYRVGFTILMVLLGIVALGVACLLTASTFGIAAPVLAVIVAYALPIIGGTAGLAGILFGGMLCVKPKEPLNYEEEGRVIPEVRFNSNDASCGVAAIYPDYLDRSTQQPADILKARRRRPLTANLLHSKRGLFSKSKKQKPVEEDSTSKRPK